MAAEAGVELADGERDLAPGAADRHGDAQQFVLGVQQAGRVGRRGVGGQRLEQHAGVGDPPAALLHGHGGLRQRRELRGRVRRRRRHLPADGQHRPWPRMAAGERRAGKPGQARERCGQGR
jgi:hypothetical protein